MSYSTIADHRSMALDTRRNEAYAAALKRVIGPTSVVLDLGAGTGIHGLIAARLGAKRVYLVEPEDVGLLADELAGANDLRDRVQRLHGRIQDVQVPERVDVIVSAMTGNFLMTEDLLPALFHARDACLQPNGSLIPSAATMEAVPISDERLHEREVGGWSKLQQGVDLSRARTYAANTIYYRSAELRDAVWLADPVTLSTVDLHRSDYSPVHAEASCRIRTSGTCHGWVGWFRMKLGDCWLSTSPREAAMHWSAAYLPLDPPVAFERGAEVSFALDRPPFGDWTWRVRSDRVDQRHSTLLSMPIDAETLRRASVDYRPALSPHGQALQHVLAECGGTKTVSEIALSLQRRWPDYAPSTAEALRVVQRIVKRYT